jgi:hypothetical protein
LELTTGSSPIVAPPEITDRILTFLRPKTVFFHDCVRKLGHNNERLIAAEILLAAQLLAG